MADFRGISEAMNPGHGEISGRDNQQKEGRKRMRHRITTVLKTGVSCLALSFSQTSVSAQSTLARAQVVGGANACPAIFVSFNAPLAFSGKSLVNGGLGLRIRLSRGAVPAPATGGALIETYPNLKMPNLGQVGITLDSGGTQPVLVMRFDQAIMSGVQVVQAGDSSIVITGISAGGGEGCAASDSGQAPPAAETADTLPAPDTPAVADMSDPAQAEIERIYSAARAAITAKDYRHATQLLTKLTQMPPHARSAEAQELLGVVRERNGQMAQARAEYEIYLETFPDSAGASRVRQRLAALLTAMSAPPALHDGSGAGPAAADAPLPPLAGVRRTPPPAGGVAVAPEPAKSFSASLSSYYYLNQGSTVLTEFNANRTTTDNTVYNNALVTSFDLSDTVETDGFSLNWRFGGDFELDMADSTKNQLRLSKAYGEFDFKNSNLALRLGRQTRYDGGIFGRFDGALLTYSINDHLTARFTAGLPVASSKDGLFSSKSVLLGASITYADLSPGLDVSAYFVNQATGPYTERRAVGLEAQFQSASASGFALIDYDINFGQLNTAKVSGTKVFANSASLTLSADISRSPLLALSNALSGQAEQTLSGLNAFYTLSEMQQLALDRSATTRSATVVYSVPISDVWMASINGSAFLTGATPASGGVAAAPSTGIEYYFTAQMVGNGVFSERDVVSISARYADTASSTLVLLDGYRRFQVSDKLRLNTRVKVGHRSVVSGSGSEWFAIPSLNMRYTQTDSLDFEMELGGRLGTITKPLTTESSSEMFMFAGFSKQF